MTSALYTYRKFIWNRAWIDLRHGYAGTSLGFGWNILHPLLLIIIYTVVFGFMLKRAIGDVQAPYAIFLCAGMLPWLAFTECISRGCTAFRLNATYLKKLPIPEEAFVAQTALTATLGLAISFSLLLIISLIAGQTPSWRWLLLPIPLLLLQIAGYGIGMGLGTMNAFFPDVGQVVPVVLRLAFWTAPILFPTSFFVERGLGWVLTINPATPAIRSIRDLFIYEALPSPALWGAMVAWAVVTWLLGLLILRALRTQVKDVL